jgi:hypothetical protein
MCLLAMDAFLSLAWGRPPRTAEHCQKALLERVL